MPTYTELLNNEAEARPIDTIDQSGSAQRRVASDRQAEIAEDNSIGDTFGAAWERNITNTMYDTVQRKWSHEPEEGFDPTAWVNENKESLEGVNLEAFNTVRSFAEAEELRDDQARATLNDEVVASKGYTGVAATLLAGIVDPTELAIGFATAGTGKAATIGGSIAKAAKLGGIGGAISGTLAYTVDPLADTKQIIYGTLGGVALGGAFGTVGHMATVSARSARDGFASAVDDLGDASIVHTEKPAFNVPDVEAVDYDFKQTNMSAGAASSMNGKINTADMSPTSASIYEAAVQSNKDNGVSVTLDDVRFNDTKAGRTAERFSDALAKQELVRGAKIDFDRMAYDGGAIEQHLAYELLESPEGRIRNNRTAAVLQENYEQRLASRSMPVMEASFDTYAKRRNMGIIDRNKPAAREAFDREVISELEARFHEGKPVSTDPAIKNAADAIDDNYNEALSVAKGREGETSVSGFEDIQPKSGFFNHKWSGRGIKKAMARGVSRNRIEALLETGYSRSYPDMDADMRKVISKAVVRRALAKDEGIDTNMLNTLDSDGQEYLRGLLKDSGYGDNVADRLIDSIRGKKEEQSKLGTTKSRVQVDLRTSDGDLSLMDLVDTNLNRVMSQYNRTISGSAALARKGIANKQQRKAVIDAAMAERSISGLSATPADRTYLEDVFTYFDAGPIGGGIDPAISRLKRLTNLGLLNQMGLTQLGETGAQVAAVGMDTWNKHAKALYKEMRGQGPKGHIISELRPMMGEIGQEHILFRDDLMLDELSTTRELNSFLGKLDFSLGKGQRIQGYVSGFYHVKGLQQKIAVASQADKVFQRIRDGADEALLKDIGINPTKFKKYIDKGMVEFDADGYVNKLNIEQWSPADQEDFVLALHRHTNQVVQKAMAGEETMWMHKTVGSMMLHLKSFPLLAMRKQTIRAMATSDGLATATLFMGLATAGLAYEAKQIINGRTERVNGMEALKGAMSMSNMTGWVPMLTDPAAAVLGMNQLKLSQYGRHNLETGVIPTPAMLPTLNKMSQGIGAANPFADLSHNERIRIMQSTPLVGNLYGTSALLNAMKE